MGTSDVKCTEDDLLVFYQNREIESYDLKPVNDATWDDIDLDAIEDYRRTRRAVQPDASELQLSDEQMLQALGCLKQINGEIKITVAGVLLFGTRLCFRRLFSDMRIEYIRVPGTTWMSDPDNRYTSSIDIRGPLLNSIRRAEAAIIDDLPKAFSLPEGSLQREDIPAIPFKVVREAVVNAVMHRDYRIHQAIQIIRYANRIEIRNPGYSLIAEEQLGEPGSKSRNLKLSEVLRDTNFAEKKGTGIGLMQQQMKNAGLSPPLFESHRSRDLFVATFLFHHFLSEEDIAWLTSFKEYQLSDEQAKALIFVREVGAINNSAYRNLNQVDTLAASTALRQLRDLELLASKNQGVATYYVPGSQFIDFSSERHQLEGKSHQPEIKSHKLEGKSHKLEGKSHKLEGKSHKLEGKSHKLEGKSHKHTDDDHPKPELLDEDKLPENLKQLLLKIGKKADKQRVREVIIALCSWKELSAAEIAHYLKRKDRNRLFKNFLAPMIDKGVLVYKYPQMPRHPHQTYRVKQEKS